MTSPYITQISAVSSRLQLLADADADADAGIFQFLGVFASLCRRRRGLSVPWRLPISAPLRHRPPIRPDLVRFHQRLVSKSGPLMLPQKRPHPDSKSQPPPLPEADQKVYLSIKSKQSMGIWTADIKKETGLSNTAVTRALKSLQNKNLIKDVVNVHNRAKKMFMAVEFEPSREISGGSWYTDGKLDTELINALKRVCLRYIAEHKVTTMEEISRSIEASRVLNVPCSMQQVLEIVRALVLDKEIEEFKSKGTGEFARVPSGKTCYRILRGKVGTEAGYLASVPCGVCPRISECTPDGVISPKTCVYYNKWLKLDF